MGEVNWIATLLLGLLLSVPFSILSNLWTPRVQHWLSMRSLSSRNKKLKRLKEEYERIKTFHDNPTHLYLTVAKTVIDTLGRIFVLIIFIPVLQAVISVKDFVGVIVWGIFLILALAFGDTLSELRDDIKKIGGFEKYEKDALASINELEGST